MKNLLHVGCGPNDIHNLPAPFQDGTWDEIRYDIDPSVNPDIVGRLQDLSLLEDASMDAVYSSHNVEHVWAFEVDAVLVEFRRVLKPDGFALILCPDMMSVAQAVTQGYLEKVLYESSAGPITAMDIIYGYHADISRGNLFMAHKTAFTADTLGQHLLQTGFPCAIVARDAMLGLHAVAFATPSELGAAKSVAQTLQPHAEHLIEVQNYGFSAG